MMEIASVQMNIWDEDKSERIERAEALLDQVKAGASGVTVINRFIGFAFNRDL